MCVFANGAGERDRRVRVQFACAFRDDALVVRHLIVITLCS